MHETLGENHKDDCSSSDDPSLIEKEVQDEENCGNRDIDELDIQEKWEKYWGQYGEGLLWQNWQEKHRDSDSELLPISEPWNNSKVKEKWEQHYSQLYWNYWEQFHYWTSQGWTVDTKPNNVTEAETSELETSQPRDRKNTGAGDGFGDVLGSEFISPLHSNASYEENHAPSDKHCDEILTEISKIKLNPEEAELSNTADNNGSQRESVMNIERQCPCGSNETETPEGRKQESCRSSGNECSNKPGWYMKI